MLGSDERGVPVIAETQEQHDRVLCVSYRCWTTLGLRKRKTHELQKIDVWRGSKLTCCVAPGVYTIHASVIGVHVSAWRFWHWLRCFFKLNDNRWPSILLDWVVGSNRLGNLGVLSRDIERAR